MFSRKSAIYKIVASFLLINIVATSLWPTIGYALTSGPTAPEFTSFEPVDTTDMVNLQTGDFVYNTPLLEVPGPEGGYPISLNYHSGVSPEIESSWIGLNWNLNVGCINRTVDTYPDDNYMSLRKVKDYWGGGTTVTKGYGIGASIPNVGISLNFGVTTSHDTYKGFSRKPFYNGELDPTSAFLNNITGKIIANAIDENNTRTGLFGEMVSKRGLSSVSTAANAGVNDLGSNGRNNLTHPSSSTSRISSITNTDNHVIGLGASGIFNINYQKNYIRYYLDQTAGMYSFGSLYGSFSDSKIGKDFDTNAKYETYGYDAYSMFDYSSVNPDEENDPEKQLGGSFPAFDQYEVLGQGIGGTMKPYIFENGTLHKQNKYDRTTESGWPDKNKALVSYQALRGFTKTKVNFKFVNDFSNSLLINDRVQPINIDHSETTPKYVVQSQEPYVNTEGYNTNTQHLAGSNHVEWFSHFEMKAGQAKEAGLMMYNAEGYSLPMSYQITEDYLQPEMGLPSYCGSASPLFGRGSGSFIADTYKASTPFDPAICTGHTYNKSFKSKIISLTNKICGFKITNASGVTYHYALPVFAYNEYTRMKRKNPKKGVPEFKEYKNDEPYAYTWLLTGVTGSDFVDVNNNGAIDDADQGYWVKFDYGKWTDSYQWRSPHTGYSSDIEDNYETFSYGLKELYYLDAIETRTHKAVFIKSIRKDAKGVTSRLEGGSKPRKYKLEFRTSSVFNPQRDGKLNYNISPVSTLKLDAIYLFNKKDYNDLNFNKKRGIKYLDAPISNRYYYAYHGAKFDVTPYEQTEREYLEEGDQMQVKYHNGDLVFDDGDLSDPTFKSQFISKALRVIELDNNHYDLCKGTPNSFERNAPIIRANTSPVTSDCFNEYSREYLENNFYSKEFFGDVNTFIDNDRCYGENFAYELTGKLTLKGLKTLGKGGADILPETKFNYSSPNPNYSDQYDTWKYFKSDYTAGFPNDHTRTRRPTSTSASSMDAWCLSSIETSLGSTINVIYEADTYGKQLIVPNPTFNIISLSQYSTNKVRVSIKGSGLDLKPYFEIGKHVKLHAMIVYKTADGKVGSILVDDDFGDIKCTSNIEPNVVTVQNTHLYNILSAGRYVVGGFIEANSNTETIGGGLRVYSLMVNDNLTNEYYYTNYSYQNPQTGLSSGVTTYEPYELPNINLPEDIDIFDQDNPNKYRKDEVKAVAFNYQLMLNKYFGKAFALSREIPGPGVMYEYVTISASGNDMNGLSKSVYQFKTFDPAMVRREVSDQVDEEDYVSKIVNIKNFTSQVGEVKSVSTYDNRGVLQSKSETTFLNEAIDNGTFQGNNQGEVHQAFNEYRKIRRKDNSFIHKALVSVREEYPSVAVSTFSKDYKTGLTSTSTNKKFDFYSGIPTEVLSKDSYGNKFITTSRPAYQVMKDAGRVYPNFGLKVTYKSNKNMLTQEAQSKTVKVAVDESTILGLVGVSVQTWDKAGPYRKFINNSYSTLAETDATKAVWRRSSQYIWSNAVLNESNDGLGKHSDFVAFNWNIQDAEQSKWKRVEQVTLYDVYSHSLEGKDINGNYSSVKLGYNNSLVIATAGNSKYTEMAYSGAEDDQLTNGYFGGEVFKSAGSISNVSHTGAHSIAVPKGGNTFVYTAKSGDIDPSKNYRVSVWLKSSGVNTPQGSLYYKVNGTIIGSKSINAQYKAGDWYLINLDIPPIGNFTTFEVGCKNDALDNSSVYFDDFRFHPLKSSFVSYVYDPSSWELNFVLDGNNLFTKYEYDKVGRLVKVYRETFSNGTVLLKAQEYNSGKKGR